MLTLRTGELTEVRPGIRVLLAPNPGDMSLDGTQTYILGPEGSSVVVDPGPLEEEHLSQLASLRPSLILITHRHADHTAGAARLSELSGAPVRAGSRDFCFGAEPLADGDTFRAGALLLQAVATPGHTSDSFSFYLTGPAAPGDSAQAELELPGDSRRPIAASDDAARPEPELSGGSGGQLAAMLTGDTILGRGTTMLDHPDGSLADYLTSLETLLAIADAADGPVTTLPAHGGLGASLADVVRYYREHRLSRLEQVRALLARLGPDEDALTQAIYPDVAPGARAAARLSVAAQVAYLQNR